MKSLNKSIPISQVVRIIDGDNELHTYNVKKINNSQFLKNRTAILDTLNKD